MKYLLATIFLVGTLFSFAKAQEKPLVQFSGIIYNADSLKAVVPYVTVINKTQGGRVYYANYQGYFSFVAHEQDTIVFSAIGFRHEALIIPAGLTDKKYTVLVKVKPEAINLPIVQIYPWASIDEFNRAFMTMKLADDDLLIAKKNVSKASIMAMARTLPRDAREMSNLNFQNNHIAMTNKNMNMRGANPLLNPFAWSALLQQILEGDKSRSSD
ncbi:MAG: carboxypeptidase-like regulatory protein [Sphingobacteriaceae bacterium]|jgi:hypothetical protein|nr:carboxypeptidase-like regulatory protein [Sphingobacteriaceae bacterium]